MAISYTNLFENIGEYVDCTNDFISFVSTIGTNLSEIESELIANNMGEIFSGEPEKFARFQQTMVTWTSELRQKVEQLLIDRTTIQEELSLASVSSLSTLWPELIADMIANTVTIEQSSVTIGSVSVDAENASVGTVITGKVLDGATSPFPNAGFQAIEHYAGVDSELADDDTISITCTRDVTSGVTAGSETWRSEGGPLRSSAFTTTQAFGSGIGPTISTLQGSSLISNATFESFTSNVPNSWTIVTGTAGTHILAEASAVFRGSSALEFVGNASLAAIEITQNVTSLTPLKRYAVAFYVQGNASLAAGTLTITMKGTGYTAATSEKIELNTAALNAQTTYGLEYFFFNAPKVIPSDFRISIALTGTPSAHSIFIDDGGMQAVNYHNGIHFNVVNGADDFVNGDRFTFTVSNDDAGVFQTYFRKAFGVQLPSDGSPSIADSLAT